MTTHKSGCLYKLPVLFFLSLLLFGPLVYCAGPLLSSLPVATMVSGKGAPQSKPGPAQATPPATPLPPAQSVEGITFAIVPPGAFLMGSPDDEPGRGTDEVQREVTIDAPFGISVTEITRRQYQAVTNAGSPIDTSDADLPVTAISWDEAQAFCTILSQRHGGRFRLPTEEEWEYTARAGGQGMFGVWRGDLAQATKRWRAGKTYELRRRARSLFTFDGQATTPVGSFPPNAWGLFDMHGNVWEWCAPGDDAPSLFDRPIRGGAWSSPTCLDCRAAKRAWERADARRASIGFRVVWEDP